MSVRLSTGLFTRGDDMQDQLILAELEPRFKYVTPWAVET